MATITLPDGLTSTTPTINGTDVSYERLLSPTIVEGDVTVTRNGETTEATNLPTVDSAGVVTLELIDAESVDGTVVTFQDRDGEWLRVEVVIDEESVGPSVQPVGEFERVCDAITALEDLLNSGAVQVVQDGQTVAFDRQDARKQLRQLMDRKAALQAAEAGTARPKKRRPVYSRIDLGGC